MVVELAQSLGVSADSLQRLGLGWSDKHGAWSFPMRDAGGNVRGIRLRAPDGRKFAVSGSKDGLFIPEGLAFETALLICEGPTDMAAMLDLGFEAIGRPSCTGGTRLLAELLSNKRPPEVVIVGDHDEPGQRGADSLASTLVVYCPAVRVIWPPEGVKDARAWLLAGATREDVLRAIEAAPVRRLKIGRSGR